MLSNVLLGVLCALASSGFQASALWPIHASILGLGGLLLYVAGNFLNDWKDLDWDLRHRPERALPRGMFRPSLYLAIAIIAGLGGVFLAATVHVSSMVVAIVLAGCIVVYTWLHKLTPWAVVPMGMCRALLPLLGYGVVPSDWEPGGFGSASVWLCAAGLFLYIAALSLHARIESSGEKGGAAIWLPNSLFIAAAAVVGCAAIFGLSLPLTLCLAGLLPYAAWTLVFATRSGMTVGRRVSGFLAGIPWVDAMLLLPLGMSMILSGTSHAQIAALAVMAPPAVVWMSRLLQRWSPAT